MRFNSLVEKIFFEEFETRFSGDLAKLKEAGVQMKRDLLGSSIKKAIEDDKEFTEWYSTEKLINIIPASILMSMKDDLVSLKDREFDRLYRLYAVCFLYIFTLDISWSEFAPRSYFDID